MENLQTIIDYVTKLNLPWEKIHNKTVLISGSTGMIGSLLVHVLLNRKENIHIIALGRNVEKAQNRFKEYWNRKDFQFICHDINEPLNHLNCPKVDFIIHAASNTHPIAYATDPIGTITANVIGTYHLLNYYKKKDAKRFLFLSSVEIYGDNRGDTDYFDEQYCGYINCNTMRAGYPESKRVGEALCQAYRNAYNMEVVIARLARTYGPTMLQEDTKAVSQFIKNGIHKQDIVLKSQGNQFYSYIYVGDAVSGLLTILLKGIDGEAYNIADAHSDITLKELAVLIASYSGTKVVFQQPDHLESAGYSQAVKAVMNGEKLQKLGWNAHWDIKRGIKETLDYFQTTEKNFEGK